MTSVSQRRQLGDRDTFTINTVPKIVNTGPPATCVDS